MIQVIKQQDRQRQINIGDQIPLKNQNRPFFYCLIICLSTLYSGYCLTVISATSLRLLMQYYHIDLTIQSTLSLLNGTLPAGGMLGSILVPNLIPLTTKKKAVYFLALASWVVCGLSVVPTLFVFVLSRFLLGVLNGLHMSLASAYIKQTFPPHIRKPLGAIYSTSRIFGMLFCYLVSEISGYPHTLDEIEHILVLLGPAFIGTVQSILFFFFMPDSIVQAITKMGEDRAMECLSYFYEGQNIEHRYQQMKKEIAGAVRRTLTYKKIKINNRKNLSSLHLAMLRQFCGQTYIVIYARQMMQFLQSPYADMSPAIINGIQLIAGVIGIYTVQKFARYHLIMLGCCSLTLFNIFIAITDYFQIPIWCMIAMTGFMLPNGICLSSVAWCYPSELVPASQGKYSSLVNWTCSTIVAMVPPYIVAVTPRDSAYPIFFFFTGYLLLAIYINYRILPKTNRFGKTAYTSASLVDKSTDNSSSLLHGR